MSSHKLKNGLRTLHIKNKSNVFSLGFIVNVGSRDEDENTYGISHFLEHMLFKSTKNRSTNQLLKDLDSLGTSYNAQTSYESTFYELHGNIKDWKKLIEILLELYLSSKCYSKDIETERGVILEEYNMVNGSIDDHIFNILTNEIYGDSPLGRSIIGTIENISSFTRNQITNFRNKFYATTNTAFITMGNVDNKSVRNWIEKISNKFIKKYSDFAHKTLFVNIRDNYVPIQNEPRINFKNVESSGQTHLLFGFHFDGFLIKDYKPYIDLISILLTIGSSSRLFNLLRTRMGVAYSVNASYMVHEDSSLFLINSSVDETKVDLVIDKILSTIRYLKKTDLKNEELKKIKRIHVNALNMFEYEKGELMFHYAEQFIRNQKLETLDQSIKKTMRVSSKKLREVINHVFRKDNINLVLMGCFKEKQKKSIINRLDDWYYKN